MRKNRMEGVRGEIKISTVRTVLGPSKRDTDHHWVLGKLNMSEMILVAISYECIHLKTTSSKNLATSNKKTYP